MVKNTKTVVVEINSINGLRDFQKTKNMHNSAFRYKLDNGNKIALIPNARDIYEDGERKTAGINKDKEELEELGFEVDILSLKDYFGKYEELKQKLDNYHAFFAIGGNSFTLRKAMQLSGFDVFLKEISKKDGYLYGGYSAGMCILAPDLHGLELVDEMINPYNDDNVLFEGIGLINYLPIPHYKSDHPESELMENVVQYCNQHGKNYKTFSDGDVEVEELSQIVER